MKMSYLLMGMAISTSISAASIQEKKLFTMEKNYNAENIMMIHTQTDEDCKFITSPKNSEKNYVEFYWIMDNGSSTKEVHSLIRSEIKDRVAFQGIDDSRESFKVKLNDLKELKHDLNDTTIEVISEIENGECVVKSILNLGASGNYRKMDIDRSYCEVTTNFIGIPNGCRFLELSGTDVETNEKFSVRFNKK